MEASTQSRVAVAGGIIILSAVALITTINNSSNSESAVSSAVQTSEYCSALLAKETPSVYCGNATYDQEADPYSDANLFAKEG